MGNYHVNIVVVPKRHDEDHALLESVTHGLQATGASEVVVVAEDGLLVLAEGIGDGVAADFDVVCDITRTLVGGLAVMPTVCTTSWRSTADPKMGPANANKAVPALIKEAIIFSALVLM